MEINDDEIRKLLAVTNKGHLHHREGQELEFKESFNLAGLADYFRDFAAFANNKGGTRIFGVGDSPRKLVGLSQSALDQFQKIDPERITGYLLDIFSGHIEWSQAIVEHNKMSFGVFRIEPSVVKPIVSKKDEGKDSIIRNGEIYFRYGGRTQKIQYPELESIINTRIKQNNSQWIDLMSKIGKAGPTNAAILDTERGVIEQGGGNVLVLDESLVKKMKFIREGEFVEKKGATALKLVGDVTPVDRIEVVKREKENILKEYPFAAKEILDRVKLLLPGTKEGEIYEIIKTNKIKDDKEYSVYNFRSKKHADSFNETGKLPVGTPSIYKPSTAYYIVQLLKNKRE